MSSFTRFAWSVLGVNLAVVAGGGIVRATGSGAGCGGNWPTCNGQVIPRSPRIETVIEFTHRVSSGIALLLVVVLVIWAVRALPRRHAARKAAWSSLTLMLFEALVGAGLVLFGWVAKDTSAARGWMMAIHLTNTFLLLAALALTAEWSARPGGLALSGRAGTVGAFALALAAVLLTGITGAIAALGDTLFPAVSFAEGLRTETSGAAYLLLRLRVLHPFAAITAGVLLLAICRHALRGRPGARVRRFALLVVGLVAGQIAVGATNLLLLAPVFLQIVHLVMADLVWLSLVLLGAAALAPGTAPARSQPSLRATA